MEEAAAPPPSPPAPVQQLQASSWSAVLRKKPAADPPEEISSRVFGCCNSSKGISVAVVDANAIINGGRLVSSADKFVSVREVLNEVRDPASRHQLSFSPLPIETMEPSPEFIKKVVKFARETGDLQTLSDVDIKLIALTYMLEAQIHGTSHLRKSLPPLHVVNVKHLSEAEMPGWGSNVPNLGEWEALEQMAESGSNHGSRILPLKDLDDNVISMCGSGTKHEGQDDGSQSFDRRRRFIFPKKEINLEGKKMVANGIDASLGEDAENGDDWRPAVSRSTHRRYLRRKARRELSKAAEENSHPSSEVSLGAATTGGDDVCSDREAECTDFIEHKSYEETLTENDELKVGTSEESDFFAVQEHMMFNFNASKPSQEEKEDDAPKVDTVVCNGNSGVVATATGDKIVDLTTAMEGDKIDMCTKELNNLEITSETDGSIDTSYIDDGSSEQSWMLRPLSDSTVACVTSDYAMQNVIMQIGLRLLAPGGMQIRQLHRWVLKCHACNKVTQEIGRIFCPQCGNGGTLRKVSVTVGENGILMAARRPRTILRGTKFSIPLPQGGREALTKNLILREDQLPHKLLYPRSKKKTAKQDQDFWSVDDIFSHTGDKRAPLKPPVRKALALFSGKRNPNDNHFSRRKH